MATKGQLTPYDDIQTRQVSSNMSEGLLGSSAARQQLASAKNLGEAGLSIADKIAAYGRKRQQQKDIEGSLKKLEFLNQQYEIILKEEKNNWLPEDPAFKRDEDYPSLTERVRERMNETDANFLENNTFTQGERDLFNVAQAKARIQLGSRAFTEEQAQDTAQRTLEMENTIELASTRAFEQGNTKDGLAIYKDYLAILSSDPEAYTEKTFEKLKDKLSNVAHSTALGLMTNHPGQLIKDLDAKLYNGLLSEPEIIALRNAAGVELRRKDSGTDTLNRAAANGQINKVLRGELRADAVNPIGWHNKDNKLLHEKKLIAAQTTSDMLKGMGTVSRSAFMDKVKSFEDIKKSSDDISRGFYEQFNSFFYGAIKDFNEAMDKDPIGAMAEYNPGLFEQLSDMNTNDRGYLEAITNWQKDQGILSANIRLISNAELDQIGNDLALTRKNINVTDLQNHAPIDQIRNTFLQLHQKYGPNYSRITAELQLHSKKHDISEAEIIASAYINKPDLFAFMIKTSMMTEQDWDALEKISGLNDSEIDAVSEAVLRNERIQKFLTQFGQFQKPARVGQMMQDVGKALAYLHKTTTGIDKKVEDLFLEGLGSYSLQTQGGDTHEIFFNRKITMKEGWSFEQNMVDPNWFFKHGAMLKIPNMTTQLTAAFYANMAYPCPTTNGDGKYNLCVFDKEAAGQTQRRLLNRSSELISVREVDLFVPMDMTVSRQDQRMKQFGKRNSGSLGAAFDNTFKAIVFLNRWNAEKQRELLDNAIGPGVDLSLENAHKLLPMTEVPPDAVKQIYPGLTLKNILRNSNPETPEQTEERQQKNEAFYVKKRDMAISWSNQMRKLDYSKNVKPETMNQYENKINDLVNFADISQTIDSNKRRHIDKLLSEIRTSIHTKDDRLVKRGINKIALEIKFLFGQSVTDGDLTTPLTAMRTQILDGRLVKTPNDLKSQTMVVDGIETEIEVEDKSLTYEQAVAKLEEIHGKEDTEFMVKQNIQSLNEEGIVYEDAAGVKRQKGKTVKEKVDKSMKKLEKMLTKPNLKALSKKESARLKDLMNRQETYTRLSGKKKSQFGAGSKKPKDLCYFEKQELKQLSERYQKNFEWNQKHGLLPPAEG